MGWKPLELSFGSCGTCGLPINARQVGWYSPEFHEIRCSSCGDSDVLAVDMEDSTPAQDPVAGSAALREAHSRNDPNWRKGAIGEYLMSLMLQEHLRTDATFLNDRAIPNAKNNVDHIVVAPSGVWAIDAKKWGGVIDYRPPNSKRVRERLFVDGVDQTRKIEEVYDFLIPIVQVIGDRNIRVRPAMAFVEAEYTFRLGIRLLIKGPLVHDGVMLADPRRLIRKINREGPLDAPAISRITSWLNAQLPPR